MLKPARSLAFRAGLVFTAVYASIFTTAMVVSAVITYLDRGPGNQRGPVLAVSYAFEDLREVDQGLALARNGRLANLSRRNPELWVVVRRGARTLRAGAVTPTIEHSVDRLQGVLEPVLFRLPGGKPALSVGAIDRAEFNGQIITIAAGGIDPRTLTMGESLHLLLGPRIPIALLMIAVLSVLAMFVAVPVFRRALRPLTINLTAIGPEDVGRRLSEPLAPTELLPLVRGFNQALDRLEFELDRRKRFVADVAHELRTPLAALSLRAESLGAGADRAALLRGLERLGHLVSQMLDLERLSLAGRQQPGIDLVTLTRDVIADLAPMAIDRGYDLSLTAPEDPVTVTGDAHAITRAITNVIGNAISHGGGAGQITITIREDQEIKVCDQGPGIPPELRQRLFQPFARGDSSADGSGLGLHLTSEIMRAHGGKVRLLPSERGACFLLRFARDRTNPR